MYGGLIGQQFMVAQVIIGSEGPNEKRDMEDEMGLKVMATQILTGLARSNEKEI